MKLSLSIFSFGFFLGAIAHESDMSRNFTKTGDAKAWIYDIKCIINDNHE